MFFATVGTLYVRNRVVKAKPLTLNPQTGSFRV